MPRSNASTATIPPLIGFAITVAILYFARDLLIPLAFALLFAFLLSPIVKRLEGWRVPRVPAVVLVFVVASAIVTIIGWLVTTQLIQIAEGMKDDTATLQRKIASLEGESKGLNDIVSTIEQLGKEVNTPKWGAPASRQSQPVQVEVVEQHNLIQAIREYAGGLMKPLGTLGLIAVFTLFMLIDRENLRNRLLRLTGQQKLQATTKAMDDAGQRVSRYVLMQFV
ncbi:MAG TPA: AI-2E family transporter, partial [Bryobacteraceae bacterium]|nr:AI-2E family transporter [Bryobacteraceae bacterium]